MKRLFICIVVLYFLLCICCACNGEFKETVQIQIQPIAIESNIPTHGVTDSSSKDTSPEESENDNDMLLHNQKLTDILPSLYYAISVGVKVPGLIPEYIDDVNTTPNIYAQANEVQARKIVDYLELLDSTEFNEVKEYKHENYLFTTSPILIKNTSDLCMFSLITSENDNSLLYIAVIPNQRLVDILAGEDILPLRYFEGRPGTFPIRDFNNALSDVLLDTNDLQNVAVVQTLNSDKPEYILNKSITAIWRHMIDTAIRINDPEENPREQSYDIKIIIGDTSYFLNTISGCFSWENGGETIRNKLDEDTLKWFLSKYMR